MSSARRCARAIEPASHEGTALRAAPRGAAEDGAADRGGQWRVRGPMASVGSGARRSECGAGRDSRDVASEGLAPRALRRNGRRTKRPRLLRGVVDCEQVVEREKEEEVSRRRLDAQRLERSPSPARARRAGRGTWFGDAAREFRQVVAENRERAKRQSLAALTWALAARGRRSVRGTKLGRPCHTLPRYRCSLSGLAGFTLRSRQGHVRMAAERFIARAPGERRVFCRTIFKHSK